MSLYIELLGRKASTSSLDPWKDYAQILKSNTFTVTDNCVQQPYESTATTSDTSPDE